jgi:Uma2 family endonuclease
MATAPDVLLEHVPEDLYLASPEFEYAEYLDGVVIEKPVPHKKHGRLVAWLSALIEQSEYGGAAEVRSKLGPMHYRLPDLAVAPKAEWLTGPDYPDKPYFLAVEILSNRKDFKATVEKCHLYHAWGVPHCWILDPETETAWQYDKDTQVMKMSELSAGSLRVSVDRIFSVFHG